MTSLFVITNEYRESAEKLADLDLDAQTVADTLEGLAGEFESKAESVAHVIRNLESMADAIKAYEAQQAERRKTFEARAERLREYLANCMQGIGREKLETPSVSLSFRKSSAVVVDDQSLIPPAFMRQPEPLPPSPDKKALGDALKAGQEVPGARLEHRKNLQIK